MNKNRIQSLTPEEKERVTNYVHNVAAATGTTPAAIAAHVGADPTLLDTAAHYPHPRGYKPPEAVSDQPSAVNDTPPATPIPSLAEAIKQL